MTPSDPFLVLSVLSSHKLHRDAALLAMECLTQMITLHLPTVSQSMFIGMCAWW